jgi:hypothetical protein
MHAPKGRWPSCLSRKSRSVIKHRFSWWCLKCLDASYIMGHGVCSTHFRFGNTCQTQIMSESDRPMRWTSARRNNFWVWLWSDRAHLHRGVFGVGTCQPNAPENTRNLYLYIFSWSNILIHTHTHKNIMIKYIYINHYGQFSQISLAFDKHFEENPHQAKDDH